jgi:rhamnose utilization protein RhaD (predicted bifunctional aldolase and dehydrogenase)/NAD(P)-dependent dehydrogenase (short-subunit alcohol dehydrogenase family)
VKTLERNLYGESEPILRVKGSGWELSTIKEQGFSPCRMDALLRLAKLDALSDLRMAAEFRVSMTDPLAPNPSVEAILHALIPSKYVDHTHAEALVAVCNTPGGAERIASLYAGRAVVIPYVMPGFRLAKACLGAVASPFPRGVIGLVLMSHGLVSFGDTAEESYSRMAELVTLAEDQLGKAGARPLDASRAPAARPVVRTDIAAFRNRLSEVAGGPAILSSHRDSRSLAFIGAADLGARALGGPVTPDHVIRTKRVPLVGRDLARYAAEYRAYYEAGAAKADPRPAMLDPAPRIVLDPEWGMIAVGRTARDAEVAGDIYGRTMDVISQAQALGGWSALPAGDIFEVEYWDLEQAKLRSPGKPPEFTGEVVVVTGAASGIGKACVDAFLSRGAAVVGLDINPAVAAPAGRAAYRGFRCDLSKEAEIRAALDEAVLAFGGVDMLVLNAGIFHPTTPIARMDSAAWDRVMTVNLDATFLMMRECHPLLKESPRGGRVAVIGSKNVPAPGPGAAAYSASKAAVSQLARVAALEWGRDGIRVNTLHPNMVFDTALWTAEVIESRAKSYGLSVEEYRTNNVLRTEVTSRDVAELAAELCGSKFAKTTGAQVPVDGGNERVI